MHSPPQTHVRIAAHQISSMLSSRFWSLRELRRSCFILKGCIQRSIELQAECGHSEQSSWMVLGSRGVGKSVAAFAFALSKCTADWSVIWVKLGRRGTPLCLMFQESQKSLQSVRKK